MTQEKKIWERKKNMIQNKCKLMEAGFIIEVMYPGWLENIVMVNKSNKK